MGLKINNPLSLLKEKGFDIGSMILNHSRDQDQIFYQILSEFDDSTTSFKVARAVRYEYENSPEIDTFS